MFNSSSVIREAVATPTVLLGNFTWRPALDMEIIGQHFMIIDVTIIIAHICFPKWSL